MVAQRNSTIWRGAANVVTRTKDRTSLVSIRILPCWCLYFILERTNGMSTFQSMG
jgi:hypothetical protein